MTFIFVQEDDTRIPFRLGIANFEQHVDLVKVTYDHRPSLASKDGLILHRMCFLGKVAPLTVGC